VCVCLCVGAYEKNNNNTYIHPRGARVKIKQRQKAIRLLVLGKLDTDGCVVSKWLPKKRPRENCVWGYETKAGRKKGAKQKPPSSDRKDSTAAPRVSG